MAAAVQPLRAVHAPVPEPETNHPSSPRLAWLWTAIGVVLVIATVALVAGPGRGLRGDIAVQKQLITEQLEVTRAQLEITERQLRIAEEQRTIALDTLATAKEQLEIAQQQLQRSDETIELQRRMLAIAQETLDQAREMNRKTVDPTPLGDR